MKSKAPKPEHIKPPFRKLRAYAFDPSLSLKPDTAVINGITYKVGLENLTPGPVGEYIEVVDYDPSCDCFYSPVDLDDPYILAQGGLDPSEGNPPSTKEWPGDRAKRAGTCRRPTCMNAC